jgi:integrase
MRTHAPGKITLAKLTVLKRTHTDKKIYVNDGGGLYLELSPNGGRSWVFRYKVHGRQREMGLGPLHTLTLAEAREKARDCRKLRLDGIDPIEQRREAKAKARLEARKPKATLRECAEAWIKAKSPEWRNAVHAAQVPQSFEAYVYPLIGDFPVAAVDTAAVMTVLRPIWQEKPETAGRVRQRLEAALNWAATAGFRDGEVPNPARWRGHLQNLLPKKTRIHTVKHFAAVDYDQMPELMPKLRQQQGPAARALEFALLTNTRTGEVLGLPWSEIRMAEQLWVLPPERAKGGRESRIPLSAAAMAVLEQMAARRGEQGDLVFPGRYGKLSAPAMLVVLRRIGYAGFTVHGTARAAFRSWCAEQTSFPHGVCEMALGHRVGAATERAYQRSDLFERRRQLAEGWAKHCDTPPRARGKVVAIGGAR